MAIVILNERQAVLLAFFISVVSVLILIPMVIRIAKYRNINDIPGLHKIHDSAIPTLGGIAIFGGFSFGFLMAVNSFLKSESYFMTALILLLFIGLKDDLLDIHPYKKILALVIAGSIMYLFTNLKFTSFHGFLGISSIPEWASFCVTVFLIVIIVNSYNLIDGIDGLSSSVGIIVSSTFGIWSWLSHDPGFAIMSAALTGALIVFLIFNLSGGKNKIFMGDTGSLVVGFILTVMAIRFNEINAGDNAFLRLKSSPAVAIAIFIIPLFDSLRVIIIRLILHLPPMKADNRHIHHLMLRAGLSHKVTTLYISMANIFIIFIGFALDQIGILWLGLVILIICIILTIPVYLIVSRKEHWNWKDNSCVRLLASEHKEPLQYPV